MNAISCLLAAMFVAFTSMSAQSHDSSHGDLALLGGSIYVIPSEEPIRDGVVLIQNGKIAAVGGRASVKIPANFQNVDCTGHTITAGFWNSHVHFFERKWANAASILASDLGRQLQEMLTRYGFTSVFDLGSMWTNTRTIRHRIESGEVAGPMIRSTGEAMVPPGALPADIVLSMMGAMKFPAPEVADAAQASAEARKLLDEGVDGIKLFASSPRSAPLPQSAIEAAVNEAHRAGKPVFVHTNNGTDVLTAVRGGVDVVAHTTPGSGPWDEAILAAVKQRRVALTPTLTIWKYFARHDRISAQEQIVKTETGQLRAWIASGGSVLFGTDLGAVDPDPSEEYSLMMESGMSFRQILASLTTAPAERFGEAQHSGRVAAGLRADLTILKGDPSKDIRALTAVEYTMRAGKFIYRAEQ
jgi:imidazolonepropionase-like amidohydrolase